MKHRWLFLLGILVAWTFASCDRWDGNEQVPAYLHIDAVDLVSDAAWSTSSGFFTSLVDAVTIEYLVESDRAWTTLGTFQLPCTVPILRQGNIDSITITPVVKQNGIASSRIRYPFYKVISFGDVELTPEDTLNLGTLQTRYISPQVMHVAWSEFFEPGPAAISLDTAVRIITYSDIVLSGRGSGVVSMTDSTVSQSFWTDTTHRIPGTSATTTLYLEMDYWSDFDFSVGLNNPRITGEASVIQSAMIVYANHDHGWQKIYINMGKLWKWYNSYPDLRLYFTVLNDPPHAGNLYLDNMKLIYM